MDLFYVNGSADEAMEHLVVRDGCKTLLMETQVSILPHFYSTHALFETACVW